MDLKHASLATQLLYPRGRYVCMRVSAPRLLITNSILWCDKDPIRLVKQVLQLLTKVIPGYNTSKPTHNDQYNKTVQRNIITIFYFTNYRIINTLFNKYKYTPCRTWSMHQWQNFDGCQAPTTFEYRPQDYEPS